MEVKTMALTYQAAEFEQNSDKLKAVFWGKV